MIIKILKQLEGYKVKEMEISEGDVNEAVGGIEDKKLKIKSAELEIIK